MRSKKFLLSAAIFFTFFLFFSSRVFAATLYLSPSSGTEFVGQSFTVSVYVSSVDQAMNATQGVVSFPIDKLSVISLSKGGSAMQLWVQEPSFSNMDGVVNFQGVVTNPGFTGAAGKIITITFLVRSAGSATLQFTSGAVLANDGKGTNILSGMTPATFTLVPAPAPQPVVSASPQPAVIATSTPVSAPAPFTITQVGEGLNGPADPRPLFEWAANEAGTPITKYLVRIGNGDWFDASSIRLSSDNDIYELPFQAPAENVPLVVEAYDDAGNITTSTTSFSIARLAPAGSQLVRGTSFLVEWGILIILALLILLLILAIIYFTRHRFAVWRVKSNKELLKVRKEFRDDLKRVEKELEADQPGRSIDLSPGTLRKRQERLREEIEHIEKDIKAIEEGDKK